MKSVSYASSDVQIQDKHKNRILRDSLKLGLNNQKTIYIMLPQHSDIHYEGGSRSDELGRKEEGEKKKNLQTKFINIHPAKAGHAL